MRRGAPARATGDRQGDLAAALAALPPPRFRLRLYVIGNAPASMRAVANARRFCDEHLAGRYELEIVDLREDPAAARGAQIVAAPTLVKLAPAPVRRFIGDLSSLERLRAGFDLEPRAPRAETPAGGWQ